MLGLSLPECNLRLLSLYQSISVSKKPGVFKGFFSRLFFNSICISGIRLELTRLELVLEALDGWFILYVRFLVFADIFFVLLLQVYAYLMCSIHHRHMSTCIQ